MHARYLQSQNLTDKLLLQAPHLTLERLHFSPTVQRPPIVQPQTPDHALPRARHLRRQLLQRLPFAQLLPQRLDLFLHLLRGGFFALLLCAGVLEAWDRGFDLGCCACAGGGIGGGRGRRGDLGLDVGQSFRFSRLDLLELGGHALLDVQVEGLRARGVCLWSRG